jgi:hypothetical protein
LDAESAFHSVGNDGGVEADASPAVEKSRSLFIVGLRKKKKKEEIYLSGSPVTTGLGQTEAETMIQ